MNTNSESKNNKEDKRLKVHSLFMAPSKAAFALFALASIGVGLATGIWYTKEIITGVIFFSVLFLLIAASNLISKEVIKIAAHKPPKKW